ncbi:MAG: hypothetical protein ACFFB0_15960 [Promethearchaeota archaeon]
MILPRNYLFKGVVRILNNNESTFIMTYSRGLMEWTGKHNIMKDPKKPVINL